LIYDKDDDKSGCTRRKDMFKFKEGLGNEIDNPV